MKKKYEGQLVGWIVCILLLPSCGREATPAADPPAPLESDAAQPAYVAPQAGRPEASGTMESVYTEIADTACEVTLEEEPASSLLACAGPAGFGLQASDFDARVSVSIVDPAGGVRSLNFYDTVTHSFSALGPRAEWRLLDGRPEAFIVRVDAYEHPEDPDRTTSYLVVAKLGAETCVTDKIPPSPEQNLKARQAADLASASPCLGSVSR